MDQDALPYRANGNIREALIRVATAELTRVIKEMCG